MTQVMTYLVQTLDFQTARTVYLDDRFPYLELKDDMFPFYRGILQKKIISISERFHFHQCILDILTFD
jgi:hypothetical protein